MAASSTPECHNSRQDTIILFWKYFVDTRSKAWLNLFWEYINGKMVAVHAEARHGYTFGHVAEMALILIRQDSHVQGFDCSRTGLVGEWFKY